MEEFSGQLQADSANNSVWCLAEDPYHRLIIGTLGSGFQIYNPETGKFTTYNVQEFRYLQRFYQLALPAE